MIDFTQPVETDENPPRPVRVLATDRPNPNHPIVVMRDDGRIFAVGLDGDGIPRLRKNGTWGNVTLRNVTHKPVRHEGWVAVVPAPPNVDYDVVASGPIRADRDRLVKAHPLLKIARITWNSDGSPVESDTPDSPPGEYNEYWRRKVEALRAEVTRLREVLDHNIVERQKVCDERDRLKCEIEAVAT